MHDSNVLCCTCSAASCQTGPSQWSQASRSRHNRQEKITPLNRHFNGGPVADGRGDSCNPAKCGPGYLNQKWGLVAEVGITPLSLATPSLNFVFDLLFLILIFENILSTKFRMDAEKKGHSEAETTLIT